MKKSVLLLIWMKKTGEVTIVLLNLNGASQWLEIPLAGIKKQVPLKRTKQKYGSDRYWFDGIC